MPFNSDPKKLLAKNGTLNHLENQKVASHSQRETEENKEHWVLHSLMLEGYDVPFKFKRQDKYKSLKGARVNLTYYPVVEKIAGLEFEVMKVVRVKLA